MHKILGFSLIEVMVTVLIVAILAAIAIPNYSQYVQKARRTDAMEKLLDMAAQQERYFFSKNQYTNSANDIGGEDSKDGYYKVTITVAEKAPYTTYTLEAKPVSGKSQSNDSICSSFKIDNTGKREAEDKSGTVSTDTCWQK